MITLGRRLVEVRFSHGHVDSAIDLAEDILYNLRRVYGRTHHSVVDMSNLLSSMHKATGNEAAVADLVQDQTGGEVPEERRKFGLTNTSDPSQAFEVVKTNLDYLLQFYKGQGASENPVGSYAVAIQELSKRLGQFSDTQIQTLSMERPGTWGFVRELSEDNAEDGNSVL